MKKYLAMALACILITAVSAAPGSAQDQPTGLFEQPFLLTSAGQNADVQMAAVLAKRATLNYSLVKLAGAGDLQGMKTLVLVVGASLKGLGAAGLDMEKEKARIRSLVEAAGKAGIPILCLHLGGEARRGTQTDELITEIVPLSWLVIVVKSGNGDGIFTRLCQAKNIPLIEVEKTLDALPPFKNAFR